MPIRAVLFDVGDTLWHAAEAPPRAEFERLSAERAATFFEECGLFCPDPSSVASAAWAAIEAAIDDARTSDLVERDLPSIARGVMARHGLLVPRETASDFLEAIYLSGAEGGKRAFPGAAPTLAELKERGFKLATVTNRGFGGDRFRRDIADAGLDLGWDTHVVSCEVGFMKPHVTPFLRALADLGVAPDEALMVGDSLRADIAGAQRLHIATAWKRCQPDAEGVTPDFAFDELLELLDIPLLQAAG